MSISDWLKPTTSNNKNTENSSVENASKTLTTVKNLNGVDAATTNKMNSSFNQSSNVTNWDNKANDAYSNFSSIASNQNIVSQDVKNKINSQFVVPSAVTEADAYLSQQLEKIQSGKTSYSDQVKDMMDKILNREKFSYDVDADPLFQQALASAMNSGKQAMQDTIGQASALTGGYGSTYATTAGNQAYNAFIEDAYDNLPQYYQMALEAYQMEGDEMYRQLDMFNTADDKEYNRNVTAYDATYQHRNRMYDEAYQMFRDEKSDAFGMANLQLNEHGQKASDAYNLFNASSNMADKLYEREYSQWADEVNLAYKYAEMLNSDWWNQTNFDESVRQYEKNYAQTEDHFTRNQQFQASEAQKDRDFQASENAKNRAIKISNNNGDNKTATQKQREDALKAYNAGGTEGLKKYIASIPSDTAKQDAANYAAQYGDSWVADYDEFSKWSISEDTYNGGFLGLPLWQGDDNNDVYSKTNGMKTETITFKNLKNQIEDSALPQNMKDELITKLKNQSKN